MIKRKLLFGLFLIQNLVFNASCVNELDVNTSTGINTLVVEGFITTAPGPHTVLLSRSAKFGTVFEALAGPVEGATVSIRDANGQVTFLNEVESGVYQTSNSFQGQVGNAYSLLVLTEQGESYQSIPETIKPVPPIDSIYFVFVEEPTLQGEFPVTGVDIVVELTDKVASEDYYMWRNSGVYLFRTRPDLWCDPRLPPCLIPTGKPCCDQCFNREIADNSIRISSDRNFSGKLTTIAATVIDDGLRFHQKYLMKVEQYSISREAFEFFDLLKGQLSISGDIFDLPPATIGTNVINIDEPNKDVIGYFWAGDVRVDSIFIFREDLNVPQPLRFIADDCREFEQATLEPPFKPW
jgi:hypothetical protein